MDKELLEAIREYKDTYLKLPFHAEVGWIDDFQRRARKYDQALKNLLQTIIDWKDSG